MEKKKLSILFIICLANSVIYTLPYLQSTYYDSMQAAYGFTHVQMGNLIGIYGTCNLAAYLFGGMAADVIDTKKLFVFSLTITGVTGVYSALLPSYTAMLLLSVVWSFSTILTFWPAMIKAVKNLADGAHQGQVFGLKETICCIITFAISMIGLQLFKVSGENFVWLVIFYSVCHLIIAFLIFMFMPAAPGNGKFRFKTLLHGMEKVIMLKGVWLIGVTIFFGQLASIIFGRFTPFLTNVGGLSSSTAALISIVGVNGFANIGSIAGGKISDAIGSPSKFISIVMAFCAATAFIFVMLPWNKQTLILCVAVSVIFRIYNGALRSCFFATMSQVDIPKNLTGTASGMISIIGYMPDVFAYTMCGKVMESFPVITSYRIIFAGLAVCCVLGCVAAACLHKYSQKIKTKILR